MPDYDPVRLAKLLELAAHPSSNPGEALNSLRAAQSLLRRAGASLTGLVDPRAATPAATEPSELQDLHLRIGRLTADVERLRVDNARLRKANARLERRRAELEAAQGDDGSGPGPDDGVEIPPASRPKARITADVVSVYDLLADWRSVADLTEKLGPGVSQAGVKKIVRLLDDQGLLRLVESWPTRYRLRFEGELSHEAKQFRARIEDARAGVERARSNGIGD